MTGLTVNQPTIGVPRDFIEHRMRNLSASEIRVFLYLCLRAADSKDSSVPASLATVAKATRVSARTAATALSNLIDAALIERSRTVGSTSRYRIVMRHPSSGGAVQVDRPSVTGKVAELVRRLIEAEPTADTLSMLAAAADRNQARLLAALEALYKRGHRLDPENPGLLGAAVADELRRQQN